MENAVKLMLEKLDGANLREKEENEKRAAARELVRQKQLEEAEKQRKWELENAERLKAEAVAAEKAKWKVDQEADGKEAERLKKQFKERMQPKAAKKKQIKDIPTIVLDLGSNSIKAGFAGQDAPSVIMSSVVGHVRGEHFMDLEKHAHIDKDVYCGDEVWAFKDVLSIKRVIKNGVIADFGDLKHLLDKVIFEELKVNPNEVHHHPILVTEPPMNPKWMREKLMKLLFDTYNFAAMYVANTTTLSLYATGEVSGVVVECGYDVSTAAAVFEGDVIPESLCRIELAGRELDNYMIRLLNEKGYRFNEMSTLDGFIIRDIKESLCEVTVDAEELKEAREHALPEEYDTACNGNDMLPGYESKRFPDKLTITHERFQCPEALFSPRLCTGKDLVIPGLHSMVQKSVSDVGIDLTRVMYNNVIIAGGTSMMTGFGERLKQELKALVPASVNVNVSGSPQRHFAAWMGGSILACAKSFNFHWVSREEYKEYGLEMAHHSY